jgi:hypothetical protein
MHNSRGTKIKSATTSLLIATGLLVSATGRASPKDCIASHSTGQREAKAGHLRLATQLFTQCGSDETCPDRLRQECAEFLQAVGQTVPTVIFSVLDEKNQDISQVKVFSLDELIVDGLDGRAVQVDPGKHRLRFLLPWGAVLSSDVLIREGEKNRLIQVKIAEASADSGNVPTHDSKKDPALAAPTPAANPATPTPPPAVAPRNGPPIAAWIASGAALVGLGLGTTFAILGSSKKSDIEACSPNCGAAMRPTYDALKRDYLIADVGFVIGVASAGVATWLFLAPPTAHKEAASPNPVARSRQVFVRPGAVVLPGAGAFVLSGQF